MCCSVFCKGKEMGPAEAKLLFCNYQPIFGVTFGVLTPWQMDKTATDICSSSKQLEMGPAEAKLLFCNSFPQLVGQFSGSMALQMAVCVDPIADGQIQHILLNILTILKHSEIKNGTARGPIFRVSAGADGSL